jgi:hypothetical protein
MVETEQAGETGRQIPAPPDPDRCTFVMHTGERCFNAISYHFQGGNEGMRMCPWHASRLAVASAPTLPPGEFVTRLESAMSSRSWWERSREGRAYELLTNHHAWASSDDWCEVFGCCGRGWEEWEDKGAYGELRAAHVLAGLPIPEWISGWRSHPPRRLALPLRASHNPSRYEDEVAAY